MLFRSSTGTLPRMSCFGREIVVGRHREPQKTTYGGGTACRTALSGFNTRWRTSWNIFQFAVFCTSRRLFDSSRCLGGVGSGATIATPCAVGFCHSSEERLPKKGPVCRSRQFLGRGGDGQHLTNQTGRDILSARLKRSFVSEGLENILCVVF